MLSWCEQYQYKPVRILYMLYMHMLCCTCEYMNCTYIRTCTVSSGAVVWCLRLLCVRSWGGLLTRQKEARSGQWGLWLSLATKMELRVCMYEMTVWTCSTIPTSTSNVPSHGRLGDGHGQTACSYTVCTYVPHSLNTVLPQHTYVHYCVHSTYVRIIYTVLVRYLCIYVCYLLTYTYVCVCT